MVDSRFEPTSTAKNHALRNDTDILFTRKLNDGQEFQVIKIFYPPDSLREQFSQVGFNVDVKLTDKYFIYASGVKPS